MKLTNPHTKQLFTWIISIGIALMIAIIFDAIIPSFWNYGRFIRYGLYLLSVILCAYIINWALKYSIHLWLTQSQLKMIIYWGLSLGISILLPLLGIKLESSIPEFVFHGYAVWINRIINLVVPYIIQPYFLMIFLLSIVNRLTELIPGRTNDNHAKIKLFNLYYPMIFTVTFLAISLLPLSGITDLGNIENAFRGRAWLIKMYSGVLVKLGNVVFDNSLIARDNWLIFAGENNLNDFQNAFPFSDQQLETIQHKLDSVSERLAAKGIKLIVIIPPNKNTIYPEYVPDEIPKIGEQSRLDQLVNYEKQFGIVKVLDLRPTLMAARNQNWIYYRTDTHWNYYGTFIAYQEIVKELQNWYPDLIPHTLSDYQIVERKHTGDIGRNMIKYPISENSWIFKPLYKRNFTSTIIQGDRPGVQYIETTMPDTNLPRLLMFRDSFATVLQPFLSDHFSHAVYIWSLPENESEYDSGDPDVVIIEVTERNISRLLNIPE